MTGTPREARYAKPKHKLAMDGRKIHPNSLAAQCRDNPELAKRIEEGRKAFNDDQRHLESWARWGFGPAVSSE